MSQTECIEVDCSMNDPAQSEKVRRFAQHRRLSGSRGARDDD
jgi:hypothetical protein